MASNRKSILKRPLYSAMDGIIYPAFFPPKCFREALDYEHRKHDVFIVTYPKCGTTWMQNVVLYIFRKGRELEDVSQFRQFSPFIDLMGKEGIDDMPRPGAFKTHIPYTKMRRSSEAKYIFVARNPKDCVVSFYHHTQSSPIFGYWDADFDDFFELFMAGEVEFNDYFDHLLSWYPHRNDPNVYYTTYEEMKKDIKKVVIDLAKFLGDEFIETIEKDNAVLNNIVYYSGFEYMKKHFNDLNLSKSIAPGSTGNESLEYKAKFMSKLNLPKVLPEANFIRKGIVGDWKNALTEEQKERLDRKFYERTAGTDIPTWFDFECQ